MQKVVHPELEFQKGKQTLYIVPLQIWNGSKRFTSFRSKLKVEANDLCRSAATEGSKVFDLCRSVVMEDSKAFASAKQSVINKRAVIISSINN